MRRSNRTIAGLLGGLILLGFSYPFIAYLTAPKNNFSDPNVSPNAAVRGAFVNSGSRDIGRDPNYRPLTKRDTSNP